MKTIQVVAAIIRKEGRILATQRGSGEFAGGWEFPGGKIEPGESKEEALIREIKEELDLDIKVEEFVYRVEYDYPKFHLQMDCFFASIREGEIVLTEHREAKWLTKEMLYEVDWLPADIDLISVLTEMEWK